MSTPATTITNYLLLHLSREFPGLDVWRAAVVKARTDRGYVQAGETGQADLTGVWGGRCRACDRMRHASGGCLGFIPSGRSIWIEIKAPGDSQSKAQKDFQFRVASKGALYILCWVKKKETVKEIQAIAALSPKMRFHAEHPAEIQAFFDELRTQL
jgi:hypothetical protein